VKSYQVDKNPRATASLNFAIALGSAAQVGIIKTHLPVISNRLTPVTSHLEGVGNYLAACAAKTLVHLHTTSFRWDYFTLHLSVCQAFDENSFSMVESFTL
jgi:hypothetical protein